MIDTSTGPISEVLECHGPGQDVCAGIEGCPQVMWSLTRDQVAAWLHGTVTISPASTWLTQSKDPQKAGQEDTLACGFSRYSQPLPFLPLQLQSLGVWHPPIQPPPQCFWADLTMPS